MDSSDSGSGSRHCTTTPCQYEQKDRGHDVMLSASENLGYLLPASLYTQGHMAIPNF